MDAIRIRGARTHNLKNVSLDLPRGELIVVTGVSGSGKSSLAFDTLAAEGQRRYVESLSTYARQILAPFPRADVDEISGLTPVIAIDQKTTGATVRSTVGTATEVADHLRVLFARLGTPYCPEHGLKLRAESVAAMVDRTLAHEENARVLLAAPVARSEAVRLHEVIGRLLAEGYMRFRIDGVVETFETPPPEGEPALRTVDVVVDRLRVRPDQRERLAESFEAALALGNGRATLINADTGAETHFSSRNACPLCDFTAGCLEPRLFSPNTPQGACPECGGTGERETFDAARIVTHPERSVDGGALEGWSEENPGNLQRLRRAARALKIPTDIPWRELEAAQRTALLYGGGTAQELDPPFPGVIPTLEELWSEEENPCRSALMRFRGPVSCRRCGGTGLGPAARSVRLGDEPDAPTLEDLVRMPLTGLLRFFESLTWSDARSEVAEPLLEAIRSRLRFLCEVGVGYLTLSRRADTLSGGEAQRIRLAGQIGSGLTGILYILDEPSIGLHPRDNGRLIGTIRRLRDQGNTVLVVEHDEEMMRAADRIVDMGPGAGEAGGEVLAVGSPAEIGRAPRSVTGPYLSGQRRMSGASDDRFSPEKATWLRLEGASGHNLKGVTLSLPVGALTVVTGPSGSGKSSLINGTLVPLLRARLHRAERVPLPYASLTGAECFEKVVVVDQAPIGRTPRSNPATYTGLFTHVREAFAQTQTARERGYGPGRFSFNTKGGRCEACQGDGVVRVEMQFMPDVFVTCEVCGGERYNRETLECRYKGHSIGDVLRLTVDEVLTLFEANPQAARKLKALQEVGLGYIRLGQSAATLSGGEAQRVKLAAELAREASGRTLYVLDEPTTGLHFRDVEQLLRALRRLTALGNTVVVIEHDVDVMRTADWMIDLGPEGGEAGGRIVAEGTPEALRSDPNSVTGPYLR